MMTRSEDRDEDLPARLRIPLLSMLLAFVTVFGLVVHGYLTTNVFWGPRGSSAAFALASNLLIIGAIWRLSRLAPSRMTTIVLLALLAFAALLGFSSIALIIKTQRAYDFRGLYYWKTLALLAANLVVLAGAVWGAWALKPWTRMKGSSEPVSPSTRRTQQLFGLSGVVGVLAVAALTFGAQDSDGKSAVWSNSPNLSPGFAVAAIVIWLLSVAIAWWWYHSADEHERRANDVGFLAGGGLFMAAAPVWWIASRAGLAPPPDAMILWYATIVAMGIGWWWYRSR